MKTRRISLVATVVMGLLAMSSVAMADEDTEFSYGYDANSHFLEINLAPLSPLDDTPIEEESIEAEIDVTGPAGQINQGMFMRAFNAWFDTLDLEYGRGCLVRHLAQSGLGIENQIKTSDADSDSEPDTEVTVELTTVQTDCEHPDEDETEDQAETQGEGRGKGKGKGRPASPGKSGSAPGRAGR